MNEEKAIKILKDTRQAWARIVYRYILKQQKEIEKLNIDIEARKEEKCLLIEDMNKYYDAYIQQEKEIEELKKDNENQWRHRCKMAIELDTNVVSKDKIKQILKKYSEKEDCTYKELIGFVEEIKQLLEE